MPRTIAAIVLAAVAYAAAASPSGAAEDAAAYDLLFKTGTLDALPRDGELIYARTVIRGDSPEAAERATGSLALDFIGGDPEQASLQFRKDDKHSTIGTFPASVGNPVIMYFVETVVRDMAEIAGGSPFYIRNRVKDALVGPAEIETTTIEFGDARMPAKVVTMHPFADDPNRDRMAGFGDLTLTVVMSEDVPGWYNSLSATVPADDGAPAYASSITLSQTGQ